MTASRTTRLSTVGRPRALTREQVIDAALRLGLDGFTMKGVAAELGVTIATLYTYVVDRDELLRLAVGKALAAMKMPVDTGQHWSDYLRQFARTLSKALLADPYVLDRVIHWGLGLETEIRLTENFLEALSRRGFETAEALRIVRLVGATVFGAAVRTHSDQARIDRSGSLHAAFEEALTHYPAEETPLVRSVDLITTPSGLELIEAMLIPLIEQIARGRDEKLQDI